MDCDELLSYLTFSDEDRLVQKSDRSICKKCLKKKKSFTPLHD